MLAEKVILLGLASQYFLHCFIVFKWALLLLWSTWHKWVPPTSVETSSDLLTSSDMRRDHHSMTLGSPGLLFLRTLELKQFQCAQTGQSCIMSVFNKTLLQLSLKLGNNCCFSPFLQRLSWKILSYLKEWQSVTNLSARMEWMTHRKMEGSVLTFQLEMR